MVSILVVDKNHALCDIMVRYLSFQPDFEVIGVGHDGREAVKKVRELRPELLILDLGLPILDGLEVLDTLSSELPKVLVITAFSKEEILQTAIKKGASYCLVKPFYLTALEKTIREVCAFKEEIVLDKSLIGIVVDDHTLTYCVEEFLKNIGIKSQLKGHSYLKEALLLILSNKAYLVDGLTKSLYPTLAKKYHTSPVNVEAAIRSALHSAWKTNSRNILSILPTSLASNCCPTNTQFLNIAKREILRQSIKK